MLLQKKNRKDYAVKRDQREAHGYPELPFGPDVAACAPHGQRVVQ